MTRRWAPLIAAVSGIAATAAVAAGVGMSALDSLELIGTAVGAAAGAGGIGFVTLVALRRRSVGVQAIVVALTAVVAVAAGALAAAGAMYVETADLHALAVVIVAGGTVGVVCALLLGRRVLAGSRALGEVARSIANGQSPRSAVAMPIGELAAL